MANSGVLTKALKERLKELRRCGACLGCHGKVILRIRNGNLEYKCDTPSQIDCAVNWGTHGGFIGIHRTWKWILK